MASLAPIWVKITDFGIAKRWTGTALDTNCGTAAYRSPEQLGFLPPAYRAPRGAYTNNIDMWALGAIVHEMLTREIPFRETYPSGDTDLTLPTVVSADLMVDTGLLYAYCQGIKPFPCDSLQRAGVSDEGVEFVKNLMVVDPAKRLSAVAALANPWLRREGSAAQQTATNSPALTLPPPSDSVDKENKDRGSTTKLQRRRSRSPTLSAWNPRHQERQSEPLPIANIGREQKDTAESVDATVRLGSSTSYRLPPSEMPLGLYQRAAPVRLAASDNYMTANIERRQKEEASPVNAPFKPHTTSDWRPFPATAYQQTAPVRLGVRNIVTSANTKRQQQDPATSADALVRPKSTAIRSPPAATDQRRAPQVDGGASESLTTSPMPWEPQYYGWGGLADRFVEETVDLPIEQVDNHLDTPRVLAQFQGGDTLINADKQPSQGARHQQRETMLQRTVVVPPYRGDIAIEFDDEMSSDEDQLNSAEDPSDDTPNRYNENWAEIGREDRAAESQVTEVRALLRSSLVGVRRLIIEAGRETARSFPAQ